jgi:2,4-dienoyl-CoA reductase-like NADH-dependent reductase (Old Yellow Enzyme family)
VFPSVFQPLQIRGATIRNRIMSTGHETGMVGPDGITDQLIAYHETRAEGGAGLIVVEVASIHPTATFVRHSIKLYSDDVIPGYRRLADAVHTHGATLFGQLFHPGREILESIDGSAPPSYAPSAVPNERFHVMPVPMSMGLIREVIAGYGDGARRLQQAGLDGCEILCSMGYLLAQFLSPRVNLRDDEYGGNFENRLRIVREIIADIRTNVGEEMVVGIRISSDEMSPGGLIPEEAMSICEALDEEPGLDYFNVIAGSSDTLRGSIHIVPPMSVEHAYLAPFAAALKSRVSKLVFVGGRINQPQQAEQIVASGQADMCGMTRAMICDPDMPNKSRAGRAEDVRACIGCNQACIGHFHQGYPISCIQNPVTGRELELKQFLQADRPRRVMVVGGGPGGMKAASVAASRGHDVTLYEAGDRLGGQALLAQLLPGRAEFGGIITNLQREIELAGVHVKTAKKVDRKLVEAESPDAVVLATGAHPRWPASESVADAHAVDAWQVLRDQVNVGSSVVIADWRCDWVGLGLAESLARNGCRVRLCCNGYMPGQTIQQYVRDAWLGVMQKLGVEIIPMVRLHAADEDTAYFQHTTNGEPVLCENMDTLIVSMGHEPERDLETALEGWDGDIRIIGDCLSPRTAEEAVLEGLRAGASL